TVIVDGRMMCSCLMLGAEAEGHKIQTIEGLAQGDKLHPLQKKFIEMAALQCGICTPGFLVASKALLDRNPNPSETEIRYWLASKVLRSPHAHAGITSIDTTAAAKLPGVKSVITFKDFAEQPNENVTAGEMAVNLRDVTRNIMAREKVLYDGHAVAAVAATSE